MWYKQLIIHIVELHVPLISTPNWNWLGDSLISLKIMYKIWFISAIIYDYKPVSCCMHVNNSSHVNGIISDYQSISIGLSVCQCVFVPFQAYATCLSCIEHRVICGPKTPIPQKKWTTLHFRNSSRANDLQTLFKVYKSILRCVLCLL